MTAMQPQQKTGRKILAELAERTQWTLWKLGDSNRKLPIDPHKPGALAKSNDPKTWGSFERVRVAYQRDPGAFRGFLFALTADDPYTVIDLDHCRNPETGEIELWAQVIIDSFASYAEVSPSGTGVHIWIRGRMPDDQGRKHGAIEAYSTLRFISVTGQQVDGTPREIADRQAELASFVEKTFPSRGQTPKPALVVATASTRGMSDAQLLTKALQAKNGPFFAALWAGAWEGRYASQSEADLALCSTLAFYTNGDAVRMDALFRQSRLYRPKWDERHGAQTYGERTIDQALSGQRTFYTGEQILRERSERSEESHGQQEDTSLLSLLSQAPTFPVLRSEAYHGLVGDIVQLLAPHTEADPVAILVQLLVAFGSAAGKGPFWRAGADVHHVNLFAVIVGTTAGGRKGHSFGLAKARVAEADSEWAKKRLLGGLSSGEGLIHNVRDPVPGGDEGVSDKRLLCYEPEFASVLKVATRDGNTLSAIVRQAWDGHQLGVMAKNAPARATDPHISIIGHITADELTRHMTTTEAGNGFGNRFLWVCSRRSRELPDGGDFSSIAENLNRLQAQLLEALTLAKTPREIRRDPERARALWHREYHRLTQPRPGLLGAMTARAEAQVMRLACLYALIDKATVIREEHLEAALALWDYTEDSARYIFGASMGDPTADAILQALAGAPDGMTQTQLSTHFGRHVSAAELARALGKLQDLRLIEAIQEKTEGRPATRWKAVPRERSERSEERRADNSHNSLISQSGQPSDIRDLAARLANCRHEVTKEYEDGQVRCDLCDELLSAPIAVRAGGAA